MNGHPDSARLGIPPGGRMAEGDVGVIHGRFQVFHNDHLEYLLAGRARSRHLVIGITNPDPVLTRDDEVDLRRSLREANPLTYFERYTMIRAVLAGEGIDESSCSIVPFPVNLPDLYGCYVPLDATFFLTIYDAWGRRKRERFQAAGLKTEVLWEKSPDEKAMSGSDIRDRMARGDAWEHLVPRAAAELMKRWGIPARCGRLLGITDPRDDMPHART